MARPNISFTKGTGALKRPLPGNDHISGLLFLNNSLPSGFSSTSRVKQVFSLAEAVALGLDATYADATAATASYQYTNVGSNGDTSTLKVTHIKEDLTVETVTLSAYTKASSESTTTDVAAAVVVLINAGTATHGYSATNSTNTVTITAPKRLGVYLNTGSPFAATNVGTIAGTLTAFSGGVGSKRAVYNYHVSEFFRIVPNGNLRVGIYAVPSPYDFTEITYMQQAANGEIRQIGVYVDSTSFSTSHITSINTVCVANDALKRNISALYVGDLSATASIGSFTDLSTFSNNKVSALVSQDGGARGRYLYLTVGKSIGTLGATLGAIAKAAVHESIAWVEKFNMTSGNELQVLGFTNGQLLSDVAITDGAKDALNTKRYIYMDYQTNYAGSYHVDTHTAIAASSDYAYIEDNRVIDKAIRVINTALTPKLNSPLVLNADGTLREETISGFLTLVEPQLDQMAREENIGAYVVTIDPEQDVNTTSTIEVGVELVKNGVARFITIPISY